MSTRETDPAPQAPAPTSLLRPLVEDLHDRTDADGDEKRDDQHRNRAPEQGLGRQQPPIRRFGDRLRETLYRIRVCRRTRQSGARHEDLRFVNPLPTNRKDVPHRCPNHLAIGIDGHRFVESPKSQLFKIRYPPVIMTREWVCADHTRRRKSPLPARPARAPRYPTDRAIGLALPACAPVRLAPWPGAPAPACARCETRWPCGPPIADFSGRA